MKSLVLASFSLACVVFLATQVTNPAYAATYTLTLTDPSNATYDGTGTLVVAGTPASGQYCLGGTCTPGDVLTSLTFTVDGYNFSAADSGASGISATFTGGVLTNIQFNEAVVGNDQLHMQVSGPLTYSFQQYYPSIYTTGTISDSLTATPLPAALPLFAGGLGLLGMVVRRKKRIKTCLLPA